MHIILDVLELLVDVVAVQYKLLLFCSSPKKTLPELELVLVLLVRVVELVDAKFKFNIKRQISLSEYAYLT